MKLINKKRENIGKALLGDGKKKITVSYQLKY